jgi:hypothetical protein
MKWTTLMTTKLSTGWRTQVQEQLWRLDNDVALLRQAVSPEPPLAQVDAGLQRAREALKERSSLSAWWSGRLVEQAWGGLQVAREDLILVQDPPTLRAQFGYLKTLILPDEGPELAYQLDPKAPTNDDDIPRQRLAQVQRRHDLKTDIDHGAIRQLRNRIIGLTVLLVIVLVVVTLSVWALAEIDLLKVMGVGALAGAVTSVVPLARAQKASGPYSATGPQMLLKVPAGAGLAFLGVVFLKPGVGGLRPATGDLQYFYAVIFGFAQQTLTQLVDKQARVMTGAASPRSGQVAPAGSTAT